MVARRVGWTAVISCRLWWLVPDQPPEAALGRVARAGGGTADGQHHRGHRGPPLPEQAM